ncbi:unnamed protein product [Paramecium octaurelia]|uniref:Uncharacterized protein n=1 Tax=Paramecium octaurelia TaxID=43137 RepID=A0A8S1W3Z7_PAROT|nr:unnamed protein product [Paramecium octaurelia]
MLANKNVQNYLMMINTMQFYKVECQKREAQQIIYKVIKWYIILQEEQIYSKSGRFQDIAILKFLHMDRSYAKKMYITKNTFGVLKNLLGIFERINEYIDGENKFKAKSKKAVWNKQTILASKSRKKYCIFLAVSTKKLEFNIYNNKLKQLLVVQHAFDPSIQYNFYSLTLGCKCGLTFNCSYQVCKVQEIIISIS